MRRDARKAEIRSTPGARGSFGRLASKRGIVGVALACLVLCAGCATGTVDQDTSSSATSAGTVSSAPPITTATTMAEPTPIDVLGEGVVDTFESLVAGDPQPLFESFSTDFRKELPLDILQGTWEDTVKLSGAYQFTKGMRYEDDRELWYRAVILEAVFEQRIVDIRFVFDLDDRISGLFFEQHVESE